MTNDVLELGRDLQNSWDVIAPILSITSEDDYLRSVERLNFLVDLIGDDETHALYSLLDTLGVVIEAYEEEHVEIPEVSGAEVLKYFMDEFNLTQSDLPEVGSQGVVSEVLNGKRELNLRQIKMLGTRFHVSPAVFLG